MLPLLWRNSEKKKEKKLQQKRLCFPAALSDVLDAFKLPENAARLGEARDTAGNDMLKSMQVVFPVVAQIQMDVIHKYGFLAEGDGEALNCQWMIICDRVAQLVECRTQDRKTRGLNPARSTRRICES